MSLQQLLLVLLLAVQCPGIEPGCFKGYKEV
jgi:hypothetical protein